VCIGNNHRTLYCYKPNLDPDPSFAFSAYLPFNWPHCLLEEMGAATSTDTRTQPATYFLGQLHIARWYSTITSNDILTLSLISENRLNSSGSFAVADKLAFRIELSRNSPVVGYAQEKQHWHPKGVCIAMLPLGGQISLCRRWPFKRFTE
jgi:hypothetical protein